MYFRSAFYQLLNFLCYSRPLAGSAVWQKEVFLTVLQCNLGCNGIGLSLSHRSLHCGTGTPGNSFSHNGPQDKADHRPYPACAEKKIVVLDLGLQLKWTRNKAL